MSAGCDAPPVPSSKQGSARPETSLTAYLPGLDETVVLVKSSHSSYAERSDGSRISLRRMRELDSRAWVQKNGRLSRALSRRTLETPDETFSVGVVFDPGADYADLGAGRRSSDPGEREAARKLVSQRLEERGKPIASELERIGIDVQKISRGIPVVFARGTGEALRSIGEVPGVALVFLAKHGTVRNHAAPNSMSDSGIASVFNANSKFAINQKIGYAELEHCGIYHEHEAFQDGMTPAVEYSHESSIPEGCSSDFDCEGECGSGDGRCVSMDGTTKCVAKHATEVMSAVVASRDGDPWGTAASTLYYYNGDFDACLGLSIDDAYAYFESNDVTNVVQSWNCFDPADEGIVQDFYARDAGILIAMAAGNSTEGGGFACPNSLNSICVGGHAAGGASMYVDSNWRNPSGVTFDWPPDDREEPDVTALGVAVQIAGLTSTSDWINLPGTSYAAPTVAALAALIKNECEVAYSGIEHQPYGVRTMIMVSAHTRNPDSEWMYSTPNPHGNDFADGAGGIYAATFGDCDDLPGSGTDGPDGGGFDVIDEGLTEGEVGPDGDPPDIDSPPPGEGEPLLLWPQNHDDPGSNDGRLYSLRGATPFVSDGTRVRVVMSWNTCPTPSYLGFAAGPPTRVAVDYDLFLYNATTKKYAFSSQSFFDNNEGFDVIVPDDGVYEIYVGKPDDSLGCIGASSEPYALWWGYWE